MLGENIKKCRLEAHLGLNEAAKLVGISPAYLSSIENNKRLNPGTQILQKIASVFNVSVDEFFKTLEDNKNAEANSEIEKAENLLRTLPDYFEDVKEVNAYIKRQPGVMSYGGHDLARFSDEEILELANDILFATKISIEKIMKKRNR